MHAPELVARTCTRCGTEQPISQFCRSSRGPAGYKGQCKTCDAAYMSEWRAKNREKERAYSRRYYSEMPAEQREARKAQIRDAYKRDRTPNRRAYLKRTYNISLERFEEMSAAQDHRCAICGGVTPDRLLAVDHDHACCPGKRSCGSCVRGLLCSNCNNGLGRFQDDPALLASALRYVTKEKS